LSIDIIGCIWRWLCSKRQSTESVAAAPGAVCLTARVGQDAKIEHLTALLSRHLKSDDGPAGIRRLAERILVHWDRMEREWISGDLRAFGTALDMCAKHSDRSDLHAADFFRIRCEVPAGDHTCDINICAQIYRSILEELMRSDDTIYGYAERMAFINETPSFFGFDYIMGLLLVRMQLDLGFYERAIETASRNLAAVYWCPYAQHYLFLATNQGYAAGVAPKPRVSTNDLSDRFCRDPFTILSSMPSKSWDKDLFPPLSTCRCSAQLPYQLATGDIDQNFNDIWNGPTIQEIRRSILDGDFTYCNKSMCPAIVNGLLPRQSEVTDPYLRDIIDNHKIIVDRGPRRLGLSHDPSCNLACPSCRRELFSIKNERRDMLRRFKHQILLPLMEDTEVSLSLSGDGDPFFSKHYREILHGLDPIKHAKVKIAILTNGQLLTRQEWEKLAPIHKQIAFINVSIDAAEGETYEDVRRPGKWSTLVENIEFLSELRRSGELRGLAINFVVQRKNYREMPAFVRLGKKWSVDRVVFRRLVDNYTFTETFKDIDICDPTNLEHQDFLEILRDSVLQSHEVVLEGIQPYFEAAQRLVTSS
jgi:sulfatase maturation enzyme AslB (radical SAM superfamily)